MKFKKKFWKKKETFIFGSPGSGRQVSGLSDILQIQHANSEKQQGEFVGLDSEEFNLCDFCGVLPKSKNSNYCNACKHENLS